MDSPYRIRKLTIENKENFNDDDLHQLDDAEIFFFLSLSLIDDGTEIKCRIFSLQILLKQRLIPSMMMMIVIICTYKMDDRIFFLLFEIFFLIYK